MFCEKISVRSFRLQTDWQTCDYLFLADKSVYVADASARLPALRSPCGRHLKKPSLAHHPLHSATGEASRWDGAYIDQHVPVYTHTHTHKDRPGTVGHWPIRTDLVSVWCHCSGTFLCGTRLDLTLHHGLVTHMEVAKDTLSLTHSRTHTPQQERRKKNSAYRETLRVGHAFTCVCAQSCKRKFFTLFKCQVQQSLESDSHIQPCWLVWMWRQYYLKIMFTVCGTKSNFSWSHLQSVKTLGGVNRHVILDEAFHLSPFVCPCLTLHTTHSHTLSHPSSPTSSPLLLFSV